MEVQTDRHLKTVLPKRGKKVRIVPCGGNLYLIVRDVGGGKVRRWWSLRFRLDGRAYERGLGACDGPNAISLNKAKKAAFARLAKIRETGTDEVMVVQQAKVDKAKAEAERIEDSKKSATFDMAAGEYIDIHRSEWSNPVHAAQWEQTLADYASPHIGKLDMRTITVDHIAGLLAPIWLTKHVTASRLRGRIEKVFGYAKVKGYFPKDSANPALLRDNLDHLLPKRQRGANKAKHHAALPWQQMPDFMAKLGRVDAVSARALEWCVFTTTRTTETLGARRSEIDLDAKVWTVPAERMKMKEQHRVALSEQALAVLECIERKGDLVFANEATGEPLSNMAMLEMTRGLVGGIGRATVHGFRSSFRDFAGDSTSFPRDLAEAALAHAVGDAVEAAYRRGDALERRRPLMQAWANHVRPEIADAKVVPMKRRGRK